MKLITLATKYGFQCYWCKHKFPLEDLSRDHITPVNRSYRGGGSKWNTKHTGEVVLACITCNANRGNMPFNDFKKLVRS